MKDYANMSPGELRTTETQDVRLTEYRCSRGHVFKDEPIDSDKPPRLLVEVDKPTQIRGIYCGICFQELVGRVAPSDSPPDENGGPITAMFNRISALEKRIEELSVNATSLPIT